MSRVRSSFASFLCSFIGIRVSVFTREQIGFKFIHDRYISLEVADHNPLLLSDSGG